MAEQDMEASSNVSLTREDLELLCFRNLLATPGERLFFKDLQSRFLLVSESLAGRLSCPIANRRWVDSHEARAVSP